jgi:hypothetical protein
MPAPVFRKTAPTMFNVLLARPFRKDAANLAYVLARPEDVPQFYQKGQYAGNMLGWCALNDNIREMMCFFGLVLKTSSRSAILQRSWGMFLLETKEE